MRIAIVHDWLVIVAKTPTEEYPKNNTINVINGLIIKRTIFISR